MSSDESDNMKPAAPSLSSRYGSVLTLGFIGGLCKAFTSVLANQTVHGLDRFIEVLDERRSPETRKRGLITVSNHVSIVDDPLIWAFLPFRYMIDTSNMRWSLGSYDLCYTNKALGSFFFAGQVLPTHRAKFSPLGGPFQPTIREAIRLLSSPPPLKTSIYPTNNSQSLSDPSMPDTDPFSFPSTPPYTYTTNGSDVWPSPSSYISNRHAWIHIFPEGRVHQHPDKTMRYFRWGVARLMLEADECPDVIPMWIEGYNEVFPENRGFPRPLPRPGKTLDIWIGENVGGEVAGNPFIGLRRRWKDLVRRETTGKDLPEPELGTLSHSLQHGKEAVDLRMECTRVVRDQVIALRRKRGLGEEDPKSSLVETWREEGLEKKETGRKNDGSFVGDG